VKKIVTIGGGTGSFMLLSGLKKFPVSIAAIVSMVDDGGSTGVLRDELGVLPPGDVRQCLVALSDSPRMMRELMSYRFGGGKLKGHSFGNLLLSALEKMSGDFLKAVDLASRILNVKGEVVPVTSEDTDLFIRLKSGKVLKGEHEVNINHKIEKSGIAKYYLQPKAKANPKALKKIKEADLIVIGPGNHYCSVLPNFAVEGIGAEIAASKAKIIYNCNLVNKRGHTENFSLDDYVDSVNQMLGKKRIDFVAYNIQKPSKKLIENYRKKGENLVAFDKFARKKRSYKIVQADLLSSKIPVYSKNDAISSVRSFIRHDSDKLARVVMAIAELGEKKNVIRSII
jgi:uncharacterized cofD-like protein